MVHVVGSISGPHHFPCKSSGFRGFLQTKFSGRGSEFSSLSGALLPKQAFQKGMVAIPFFNFLLWWLLVGVSTRL